MPLKLFRSLFDRQLLAAKRELLAGRASGGQQLEAGHREVPLLRMVRNSVPTAPVAPYRYNVLVLVLSYRTIRRFRRFKSTTAHRLQKFPRIVQMGRGMNASSHLTTTPLCDVGASDAPVPRSCSSAVGYIKAIMETSPVSGGTFEARFRGLARPYG